MSGASARSRADARAATLKYESATSHVSPRSRFSPGRPLEYASHATIYMINKPSTVDTISSCRNTRAARASACLSFVLVWRLPRHSRRWLLARSLAGGDARQATTQESDKSDKTKIHRGTGAPPVSHHGSTRHGAQRPIDPLGTTVALPWRSSIRPFGPGGQFRFVFVVATTVRCCHGLNCDAARGNRPVPEVFCKQLVRSGCHVESLVDAWDFTSSAIE